MAHLLIVEDDELLRDGLCAQLVHAGHSVSSASDGAQAQSLLESTRFDGVVLDLGLPVVDGIQVLQWIRQRLSALPVLILTARDGVDDRVQGLNAGADDYLTKPFNMAELLARMQAMLRRSRLPAFGGSLEVQSSSSKNLRLDPVRPLAWLGEEPMDLTQREWSLLSLLGQQHGPGSGPRRRAGRVANPAPRRRRRGVQRAGGVCAPPAPQAHRQWPQHPQCARPGLHAGNRKRMNVPARFSLKRQLLVWLLLPQLVLWLMGGVLAFRVALTYAEKTIDQSLTQSVRSLARQVKPMGSGLLVDFPRAARDIIEQDPEDRVAYMVSSPPGSFLLGNTKIPGMTPDLHVPRQRAPAVRSGAGRQTHARGLHGPEFWRWLYDQRMRVQVAKSLVVQQRIARELVRDVLFPLLILGAVLSVLVYEGIRRGLAPLERLEAQLAHRATASLSPIEMTQAPEEVHSLANALNQLLTTLRRSLSQEKRFLNDAAHQLRTPLAGLISQTELACKRPNPKPCASGWPRCTPAHSAVPTWCTSCCLWPVPRPRSCCTLWMWRPWPAKWRANGHPAPWLPGWTWATREKTR